jgi:hypothetical protein
MNLKTKIARAEGLMGTTVDEELVLLNMAHDNYVGLDAIGRRIWELLETPRRIDDLCRQLSEEFEGAPEDIQADVLAFLKELAAEDMVHVVDEQSA